MRQIIGWGFILALLFTVLSGCAANIKGPAWAFEEEAISVRIKADHQLNLYRGKAHTLYVCFYQLSELNGLNGLSKDPSGIRGVRPEDKAHRFGSARSGEPGKSQHLAGPHAETHVTNDLASTKSLHAQPLGTRAPTGRAPTGTMRSMVGWSRSMVG